MVEPEHFHQEHLSDVLLVGSDKQMKREESQNVIEDESKSPESTWAINLVLFEDVSLVLILDHKVDK